MKFFIVWNFFRFRLSVLGLISEWLIFVYLFWWGLLIFLWFYLGNSLGNCVFGFLRIFFSGSVFLVLFWLIVVVGLLNFGVSFFFSWFLVFFWFWFFFCCFCIGDVLLLFDGLEFFLFWLLFFFCGFWRFMLFLLFFEGVDLLFGEFLLFLLLILLFLLNLGSGKSVKLCWWCVRCWK